MSNIGTGPGIGPLIEIGSVKPISAVDTGSVAGSASQPAATTTTAPAASSSPQAAALVTSTALDAGEVPIDNSRVTQIKKAIESGTYPLVPAKISDAMIAAGLMLRTAQ